jgi:hypothetical protein
MVNFAGKGNAEGGTPHSAGKVDREQRIQGLGGEDGSARTESGQIEILRRSKWNENLPIMR